MGIFRKVSSCKRCVGRVAEKRFELRSCVVNPIWVLGGAESERGKSGQIRRKSSHPPLFREQLSTNIYVRLPSDHWRRPRFVCAEKLAALYNCMSQSKHKKVDQHMTVGEVASLLHVHEMTVRGWYTKKSLKIQRVGQKGVRIAETDLMTFLDSFNSCIVPQADATYGSVSATRKPGRTTTNEQRKEQLSRNT
jgi:excisionase family DNA binding protein